MSGTRISRRRFLTATGAAAGVAALGARPRRLIDRALALEAGSGTFDPAAVRHVVVLMQENRSFDHYFGTLAGVHGFTDPNIPYSGSTAAPFQQVGPASALPGWTGPVANGTVALEPWRLVSDPPHKNGQTTNDITHDWTPQHEVWNGGAMDRWFATHAAYDKNNSLTGQSSNDGFMTMGYLSGADMPFYHALADAFTICDGYFCSVLGPTDPNRLMLMSNSVGIGKPGGPLLTTLVQTRPSEFGKLDWPTMPEALTDAGVTWKVYGDPVAQGLFDVLPYFKNYQANPQLAANAFGWQYPANFAADVAAGMLPEVSWVLPPAQSCEHPAAPPEYGEYLVQQILQTLVSNPKVWAQTVLLIVWDENGGWFDHMPPPTAPATNTEGEYLTGMSGQGYVDGPVGVGFRVPCLVVSPFSRGGYVCSPYYTDAGGTVRLDPAGTFDHTSINRFINVVFSAQGKPVALPNLSQWRQSVTGDLTATFAGANDTSVPALPATSMADPDIAAQAVVNALAGTVGYAPVPYPSPTSNGDFPPAQDGAPLTPTYNASV